jgi:tetratricopeptide (TPR) repeat protein
VPPSGLERRAAVGLLLVVATAYASSFAGIYQFDDYNVIVREAGAQSPSAWWASQPGIRPLLKLSYALNRASPFGLAGFHAVNLLIHLACTLLVARLLLGLVPDGERAGRDARLAAWGGAALFALHPVQTEAVTYLSGRSTSLAALFALASIVAWQRGAEAPAARRWQALSVLAFGAGLLCKEYVAVVPVALLLCAATRAPAGGRWLGPALRRSAPHWGLVLLALAAAAALPRYRMLLETSLALRDPLANLATQVHGIAWLVGQLMRPDRLNADPALPVATGLDAPTLLIGAALAVALGGGAWALRRRPAIGFALLWFLLWLAPTHSLLARLDVANDRQLYLALIGPAWALARGLLGARAPAWRGSALVVLAGTLGIATHARNRVYADEIGYWADVARKAPHNARAYTNLGHALALAGRPDAAGQAYEVALQLDPASLRAAINLQLLRAAAGSVPAATAAGVAGAQP